MSDAEREPYSEVETYISRYYNQYEEERAGLGFVMTIYRRRLTSGLYALGESLKRRRLFLTVQVNAENPQGLQDEDIEDEDLSSDVSDQLDMAVLTVRSRSVRSSGSSTCSTGCRPRPSWSMCSGRSTPS